MLPAQLNRTWPEFLQLILATKRKGVVVQGTAKEPGYLERQEMPDALYQVRTPRKNASRRPAIHRRNDESGRAVRGSMKGAGYFKERLNTAAASLDAALHHIPHAGAVSKRAFDDFAANYQWKRSGVGTASRLMAMKRPDLFLCVDAKNRTGIAKAFGVSSRPCNLRRLLGSDAEDLAVSVEQGDAAAARTRSSGVGRAGCAARLALL